MSVAKLETLALQKMVNSSQTMLERRRRILHEARRMISRDGFESFTMRDLGKRAAVSIKTIYNSFGSKEIVIALAISTYFDRFISKMDFSSDAETFEGSWQRQAVSTLRDVDVPRYMKALALLYFSPTLHPDIRSVLINIVDRSWSPWLKRLEIKGELTKGLKLSDLAVDLSNILYGRALEWCSGMSDDELFVQRSLSASLLLLLGATSGEAHAEISTAYSKLQLMTSYSQEVVSAARKRIADAEIGRWERKKPPASEDVLHIVS